MCIRDRKYTDVDLGAMPDAMAIAITIAIFSSLIIFLYIKFARKKIRN